MGQRLGRLERAALAQQKASRAAKAQRKAWQDGPIKQSVPFGPRGFGSSNCADLSPMGKASKRWDHTRRRASKVR